MVLLFLVFYFSFGGIDCLVMKIVLWMWCSLVLFFC